MTEFLKPNAYTDVYELSRLGQTLAGNVKLSDMKRLTDVLVSDDGFIQYKITGIVGDKGWPGAIMELKGVLWLECNRCFKPMSFDLEREVVFRFVKDEEEADSIPIEEDDDTEVVVGSQKLNLLNWIEEEVLLSVPLIPMHEGECSTVLAEQNQAEDQAVEAAVKQNNPFAKLKELKGLRKE